MGWWAFYPLHTFGTPLHTHCTHHTLPHALYSTLPPCPIHTPSPVPGGTRWTGPCTTHTHLPPALPHPHAHTPHTAPPHTPTPFYGCDLCAVHPLLYHIVHAAAPFTSGAFAVIAYVPCTEPAPAGTFATLWHRRHLSAITFAFISTYPILCSCCSGLFIALPCDLPDRTNISPNIF